MVKPNDTTYNGLIGSMLAVSVLAVVALLVLWSWVVRRK
jgi:hypothetical protein